MRRVFLLTLLLMAACSEPVTFPDQPPAPRITMTTTREPEPPPVPKGVAEFKMDRETQSRIVMIVAISAIAFVLFLLLAVARRDIDRAIPAGIAAAFAGPAVALLIAARRMGRVLTGLASSPFFFGDIAMTMWNENQPLLFGLYCGSALLIVLLIVTALTKRDAEPRGAATLTTVAIAIIATAIGFAAFVTMDRLLLAMFDPITTDPLPQTLRHTSLGHAAQAVQVRLITTLAAAALTILILLLTVIFAFTLRRIRGRVMIVLFALIVMLGATAVERTWSDVLETSARSGHVPDTILTR